MFVFLDVDQFLGNIKAVLCSLLQRYTSSEITDKLSSSILVTVFRQLVMQVCGMKTETLSCTNNKYILLKRWNKRLFCPADDFSVGAVFFGYPPQCAAEELLLFG